jgi:hypothetical protein
MVLLLYTRHMPNQAESNSPWWRQGQAFLYAATSSFNAIHHTLPFSECFPQGV